MKFRSDINGLRAIAVIAVVLFHFGIPGMGGGFAGVDIFFVISGFLMTNIIFGKIRRDEFTLSGFYMDRARRIIPALVFLCFSLAIAGWFLLAPYDYKNLGKHIASCLGFFSNMTFWSEAGYFDQDSHEKWLLHTWSLSVEWQFYMVYPLIVIALRKFMAERTAAWMLAALGAISLTASVFVTQTSPSSAFYLLPTRAWEMIAGGLVFLFPLANTSRKIRIMLEAAGAIMILGSILSIDASAAWPGWLAAIPVMGTALIIMASRTESMLTGNSLFQFIGKTSYSIYLWHWPIVVGLNYFNLSGEPAWIAAGIAASGVAGYLSFTYIEIFASKKDRFFTSVRPILKIATIFSVVILMGAVIFLTRGIPQRMSSNFQALTKEMVMPFRTDGWCFYSVDRNMNLPVGDQGLSCKLGDKQGTIKGLVFGDSFAGHYDPFWEIIGKDNSIEINAISTNWCYPALSAEFTGSAWSRAVQQCAINRKYLADHMSDYDFVVFAGQWYAINEQHKMQGVLDALALAAAKSKLVIIMAAPTTFDVNMKSMFERKALMKSPFDISEFGTTRDQATRKANSILEEAAQKYGNVMFFDRTSLFNINGAASDVTTENIPFSLDGKHISVYGAKMSAKAFEGTATYQAFRQRLARLPSSSTTP